jgi:hypothetical protein
MVPMLLNTNESFLCANGVDARLLGYDTVDGTVSYRVLVAEGSWQFVLWVDEHTYMIKRWRTLPSTGIENGLVTLSASYAVNDVPAFDDSSFVPPRVLREASSTVQTAPDNQHSVAAP